MDEVEVGVLAIGLENGVEVVGSPALVVVADFDNDFLGSRLLTTEGVVERVIAIATESAPCKLDDLDIGAPLQPSGQGGRRGSGVLPRNEIAHIAARGSAEERIAKMVNGSIDGANLQFENHSSMLNSLSALAIRCT